MDELSEPVDFEFVFPSPDELEAEARELPAMEVAPPAKEAEHRSWNELALMLPAGFIETESDSSDQISWRHTDGSVISLIQHQGGEFSLVEANGDGAEAVWHDEGTFHIPLAGRIGKIALSCVTVGNQERFITSANAGVSRDLSVAVFLIAPSRERRAALISVIPTIAVAKPKQGTDPGA